MYFNTSLMWCSPFDGSALEKWVNAQIKTVMADLQINIIEDLYSFFRTCGDNFFYSTWGLHLPWLTVDGSGFFALNTVTPRASPRFTLQDPSGTAPKQLRQSGNEETIRVISGRRRRAGPALMTQYTARPGSLICLQKYAGDVSCRCHRTCLELFDEFCGDG